MAVDHYTGGEEADAWEGSKEKKKRRKRKKKKKINLKYSHQRNWSQCEEKACNPVVYFLFIILFFILY